MPESLSEYAAFYSGALYQTMLGDARESRELKKHIRKIEKQLAQLGYAKRELSSCVMLDIGYTCRIQGKKSYLWFEKGRWFVTAKQ